MRENGELLLDLGLSLLEGGELFAFKYAPGRQIHAERINRPSVDVNLEMQIGTSRAPRHADIADHLALVHLGTAV